MSDSGCEANCKGELSAFSYHFCLGWGLVRGTARPVSYIVDDDPVFGVERHVWPHVLRVHISRGVFAQTVRYLAAHLPCPWRNRLATWFPALFLPETVIVKGLKPDWHDEFNHEIQMYDRLKPIQGVVVPRYYGVATVEEGKRALVLSDIGGRQLAKVSYADISFDELKGMVKSAVAAIFRLGIFPADANLVNCHVVGQRVMIVDHELDEEVENDPEVTLEELIDAKTDSIMCRHWAVHKPAEPRNPEAENAAHEEWKATYGRAAMAIPQASDH